MTNQAQHAIESLEIDYDFSESDLLAWRKLILDTGNESDEA